MRRLFQSNALRRAGLFVGLILVLVPVLIASIARGEGSRTLYPEPVPGRFRAHLEWTARTYGGGDSPVILARRTLLRLYARQGEQILLGSSAINVSGEPNLGDILVYNPGIVTGLIGQEALPALAGPAVPPQPGAFTNGFSCNAYRAATGGGPNVGRIENRAQELAGPLPNPGGYTPCVYNAPVTGIYFVAFIGPSGPSSTEVPVVSGGLDNPTADDFGPLQRTSVTAWDVTVRDAGGVERPGRLFAYYFAAITGGNGRPIAATAYVVTDSGFIYRVSSRGDPFGFLFYANQLGFQINVPGQPPRPLYRALLADPTASFDDQNGLIQLQGDGEVSLSAPRYPIFANLPDPEVLTVLGIPLTPVPPLIGNLSFTGPRGGNTTGIGEGGTFSFTASQPGNYQLIISRDGVNFDPNNPQNRAFRGVASAGAPTGTAWAGQDNAFSPAQTPIAVTIPWDGRDNAGQLFPVGDFQARAVMLGGEIHFPFVDVENNIDGGPILELTNPPNGACPPWNGGCFGAFYDDRGYRTPSGVLIGQAENGPLCPGNAANPNGFGNPPNPPASDPLLGYDTRSGQRAFGFTEGGNPALPPGVCREDGGHGDKKGLDLWTFYPSNILTAPLRVIDPTAVTLRSLTATRTPAGVVVAWETGVEPGAESFHILRSSSGNLEDAVRVTGAPIPARGSATSGATYSWTDQGAGASNLTYWLEEREVSGARRLYGPVRPAPGPAAGGERVYMPVIIRR
ncbi:MAG: hypothetical protein RMK84_15035 [Oscillochloridaceae bacterium]|nr:hypothetical protein [Chloroflexaceae bacterium]MDW8391438.1 hypothetical protein [Oscillochloridaceae bacterium]